MLYHTHTQCIIMKENRLCKRIVLKWVSIDTTINKGYCCVELNHMVMIITYDIFYILRSFS